MSAAHAATTATAPARAAVRTALQVGISAVLGLLVILPLIIQEVLTGFGEQMPPGLYAWLVAAAAAITAASATLARIMAIPGVVTFTRKYLAWAAPAPAAILAPAETLAPAKAGPLVYPGEDGTRADD